MIDQKATFKDTVVFNPEINAGSFKDLLSSSHHGCSSEKVLCSENHEKIRVGGGHQNNLPIFFLRK